MCASPSVSNLPRLICLPLWYMYAPQVFRLLSQKAPFSLVSFFRDLNSGNGINSFVRLNLYPPTDSRRVPVLVSDPEIAPELTFSFREASATELNLQRSLPALSNTNTGHVFIFPILTAWLMFSEWVTHSRFSTRLSDLSPLMWLTSIFPVLGFSKNASATSL